MSLSPSWRAVAPSETLAFASLGPLRAARESARALALLIVTLSAPVCRPRPCTPAARRSKPRSPSRRATAMPDSSLRRRIYRRDHQALGPCADHHLQAADRRFGRSGAGAGARLYRRRAARSRRQGRPHGAVARRDRQHDGRRRKAVRRFAAGLVDRRAAGPAAGRRRPSWRAAPAKPSDNCSASASSRRRNMWRRSAFMSRASRPSRATSST